MFFIFRCLYYSNARSTKIKEKERKRENKIRKEKYPSCLLKQL